MSKHSVYSSDIEKLSKECDYLILDSSRGASKSYACKEYVLKRAYKLNEEFAYVRRLKTETKDIDVCDYFNDMNVSKYTQGEFDKVYVYRKRIYFVKLDESGDITLRKKIGIVFALQEYQNKKSLMYPNICTLLFEEYCTDKYYLNNEAYDFLNLCSSIFRNRKGFCVLIGNKMNIFNIYYDAFSLDRALNQKIDTIDTYTFKDENNKDVVIKIWNILKVEESSGMYYGTAAKSIDGNSYVVYEQNKLIDSIDEYNNIYQVVLNVKNVRFLMSFLQSKKDALRFTWYVEPKTSDIFKNTRCISDKYSDDLMTTRDFTALTEQEAFLFSFLKKDKIAYANNRCGTDFKNALKMLKNL
ncbi:MAG: phage DNA encapsidation protein [Candidatus Gastranaerophilales bacterium]|nr:phage DNA encapsidation protein [Candidatus Gastranaerophilales bacterium]